MYSITTQARGRALAEQLTSRLGGLLVMGVNPETMCTITLPHIFVLHNQENYAVISADSIYIY